MTSTNTNNNRNNTIQYTTTSCPVNEKIVQGENYSLTETKVHLIGRLLINTNGPSFLSSMAQVCNDFNNASTYGKSSEVLNAMGSFNYVEEDGPKALEWAIKAGFSKDQLLTYFKYGSAIATECFEKIEKLSCDLAGFNKIIAGKNYSLTAEKVSLIGYLIINTEGPNFLSSMAFVCNNFNNASTYEKSNEVFNAKKSFKYVEEDGPEALKWAIKAGFSRDQILTYFKNSSINLKDGFERIERLHNFTIFNASASVNPWKPKKLTGLISTICSYINNVINLISNREYAETLRSSANQNYSSLYNNAEACLKKIVTDQVISHDEMTNIIKKVASNITDKWDRKDIEDWLKDQS